MKYLSITILLFLLLFFTDLCNWVSYENDYLYSETTKSKLVYETKGVKFYTNNNFDIMIFNPKNMTFGVSVGKPENVNFYMNSNFFDVEPVGLVVVDGYRKSNRVESGGYFYVKNGSPYIGIKYCPEMTEYASQSILWGIRKGLPNKWLIKQPHSKVKTYRNLIGKDKTGNIVVIVSNRGGTVTIKDIVDEGLKMGVIDGILFDGGTSIDYKYKDENYLNKFKSLSTKLKKIGGVNEPTTYIYGKLI